MCNAANIRPFSEMPNENLIFIVPVNKTNHSRDFLTLCRQTKKLRIMENEIFTLIKNEDDVEVCINILQISSVESHITTCVINMANGDIINANISFNQFVSLLPKIPTR